MCRMSRKEVYAFGGCEIKQTRPIFKTEIFIYQSTNLEEEILFGKITHYVDYKMLLRSMFGNKDSTFHSSPYFTCHLN